MPRRLPGRAIQAGTITVTQLDSSTSTVIQTGGGPKITNVQVTDASWTVLDDTAVDTAGGNILITGTGFVSGCLVYIGQTPANSVGFVSSTQVRVNIPALTAGTYPVYLSNPDGGTAIRLPGVTASANPAWQTASALPDQYDGVAISLSLVATEATSYTITSGSLPPGLSLNANTGVISGTVSGVSVDTTYTFTVRATDAQLQDSPRTFTITITVSDPYFKLTTLLLSGSALSANTVVRDSSTNNFNLTVYGDARASNFTPYGTGWSYYFPASGYVTTGTLGNSLGTGDFCMECWVYSNSYATNYAAHIVITCSAQTIFLQTSGNQLRFLDFNGGSNFVLTGGSVINGRWYHIVGTRQSGTVRGFIDGQLVVTQASMNFNYGTVTNIQVSGTIESYIVGAKVTIGSVPAAYQTTSTTLSSNIFAVPTGYVSSEANTLLLTAQSNRFLNQIGNVSFATISGSPRVTSFNPFNITNTGVNGSMYFDGTTDSVRLPSNAISALPGDFTLEFWIYLISTAGNPVIYLVNATAALIIYVVSSKVVVRSFGTADLLTSVDNIQINTWTHVAVARSGSTLSLWLNGSRASGGTITYSTAFPQGEIRIATNELDAQSANGYIADLRLIKGTAQYNPSNTTITIPTAPLTAVANTQLLTLQYDQPHNNHTFLDSSSNQHLITRSGNASQGTFSPFSQVGWSNYLNGSSALTVGTTSVFAASSEDFTIECWVYRSSISNQMICGYAGPNFDYFFLTSAGAIQLNANNTYTIDSGALSWQVNTWYHIAISRTSGVVKIFRDGSQVGSNISNSSSFGLAGDFRLGDWIGNSPRYYLTGYISNFRFVKGIGVYTGNFQAPLTPLGVTQTSGTNILAISGSQTKLLTCQGNRFLDASGNATSITVQAGSPSVQAFSPFGPTGVYSPAIHGGSAYFDGSNDFLTFPDHPTMELGNRNFTVECWIYRLSLGSNHGILSKWSSPSYPFMLFVDTNNVVTFYINNSFSFSTTATINVNTWYHIAVTRSDNSFTIWLNGVSAATGTSSITMADTSQQWSVGRNEDTNVWHFNGYITNLRVVVGTAVYTSNFTPPTAPPTAIANTQLLLNFTDTAIIDSTGRNVLETVPDAKTSSVVTKFTGGSMSFDGTGDYLAMPLSENTGFGTGDFTIEGWAYLNATSGFSTIIANRVSGSDSTTGRWSLAFRNTALEFFVNGSALISSGTVSTLTWTHFAITRSSNSVRLFLNGTQVGSTTSLTTNLLSLATWIGANGAGTEPLNGYIQDLRITRGYARYAANFTAPTVSARLK